MKRLADEIGVLIFMMFGAFMGLAFAAVIMDVGILGYVMSCLAFFASVALALSIFTFLCSVIIIIFGHLKKEEFIGATITTFVSALFCFLIFKVFVFFITQVK